MKFLANENVFEPIINVLTERGHQVINVRFSNLSGATDDQIFQKAVDEQLTIITMDKDFTRMMRFPPHLCAGIIVIKIYKHNLNETTTIFQNFFAQLDEDQIRGNLVIINPDGVRIRNSP